LKQAGVTFDVLLTSPLVRAVQTAELVAHALGFRELVVAWPTLAPGGSLRRTADELAARGASVACVGHEPSISALCALAIGESSFPSFRPGQVTLVEDGRPIWTLSPDTFEQTLLG
jgi:phosphohistidine phosphatase